jgi:hypothetical protein
MLDDIAKKRSDLQYCVQMVSICMQTSTFLKAHAPAAPVVNKAIGVSPAHTTEQKDIFAMALADNEARAFWMSNFDSATTVVPWTIFYSKLCIAFNKGAPYDVNTSQAIKLNVVCHNNPSLLLGGHILLMNDMMMHRILNRRPSCSSIHIKNG